MVVCVTCDTRVCDTCGPWQTVQVASVGDNWAEISHKNAVQCTVFIY